MNQLWQVVDFEYSRNVFKKSFVLVIISVPLMVAFSIGLGLFMESRQNIKLPVGYIDQAGLLAASPFPRGSDAARLAGQEQNEFIAYAHDDAARAALDRGEIQAYFLLPASYLETRQVEVIYHKRPNDSTWRKIFDFIQINLLSSRPAEVAYRLAAGSTVTVRSLDGRREVSRGGPTFGLLMPLFVTLAFLILLLISSGYMMGAVSEEKENRTIEVLVTSISPTQLMAGKILGIAATSLTLLLAWAAIVVAGISIAVQAGVGWFSNLALDWSSILASVAIGIPAFVLACALMIAIAAMVPTTQEAQSISAIFFMLHILPVYVTWIFLKSPHHPLAVLLSLLPFTALMTTGTRNLFTIVPAWQVIASAAVQILCALGAIILAGRALRFEMLRYGKRLSWRTLFSELRGSLRNIK